MENYVFTQYRTSEYVVDPVFGSRSFYLFGNAREIGDPDLFDVSIDSQRYRYCLIEPRKVTKNKKLLLKIRRYLLTHDNYDVENDYINTFIIGDMEKSVDVSSDFTDQNVVLVTYEMIEQWYPKNLNDIFLIISKFILNQQSYLGEHHFFNSLSDDVVFVDSQLNDLEKRNYKRYLRKCMVDQGLISMVSDGVHEDCFVLTAKAIELVQNTREDANKVAFIAIKFGENEERINAIQNAIAEAGFEPRIMNQLETNNWIMPEIFYQIECSRFVVADFSIPCDGAYYEAGYAAALKKPVIHLFDKREERENNKLHFDIAQKSTIFYEDYEDLKNRLLSRIKATIR